MEKKATRRATITALGRSVPERVLSNRDLEKMVDTTDDWIVERTGIRERRIAERGVGASDLAVKAAREALSRRGFSADQIEAILVATVTPDMMLPATACLVQTRLGASRAWGFDVSAACSGFLYALTTGVQFVATGAHERVLVIGVDIMSSIIDYSDRATCVLFGDGAGAVLVEPVREGEDAGFLDFIHAVDGSGGDFLCLPGGGSKHPATNETVEKRMHFVHQDGKQVFKYAVRQFEDLSKRLLARNGFSAADVALMVPHQANARIIDATADRLGLPPEKVMKNIERFGNTTAGTLPLALYDAHEEGRLRKGDLVLLVTVGAGFTSGASLLRWTGLAGA